MFHVPDHHAKVVPSKRSVVISCKKIGKLDGGRHNASLILDFDPMTQVDELSPGDTLGNDFGRANDCGIASMEIVGQNLANLVPHDLVIIEMDKISRHKETLIEIPTSNARTSLTGSNSA
jgi:hypothetical protein